MSLENPATLAPPPQQTVELTAQEWRQFFYFVWESLQTLGSLTVNNTFSSVNTLSLDGIRFAGESYKSGSRIQDAIDAAGPDGAVFIPPGYEGTDSYQNENNIAIIDFRHEQLGVWSRIAPSFPIASSVLGTFPLGADLVLTTRGPADWYMETMKAYTTTATTMNIGTTTITVGAVNCGTTRRGVNVTGTTAQLALNGGLIIGRDTATEEVVPSGSWSILSATTLSVTCAIAHPAGTTDVEQIGVPSIVARGLIIDSQDIAPTHGAMGHSPMKIYDSQLNVIGYLPTNLADTWPYAGIRLNAFLTGANGANGDLNMRMSAAASLWNFYNNTAGAIVLQLKNNGDLAIGGKMTVNSATLLASTTTLTNGAGVALGTLTNAPTAGDPSKWILIDDNGTTRKIPTWT